jgi:hypothetical protein
MRHQQQPRVNDDWFESRTSFPSYPPPPPRRGSGGAFAAVAALLVGGTLAATVFLWSTGQLPQWTGTGPAMDQGRMDEVEVPTMTAEDVADTTGMVAPQALLAPTGDEIGPLEKSGATATQPPMYDVDEDGNPVSNTTTTGADISPPPRPVPSAAKPTAPPDLTSRPDDDSPAPSPVPSSTDDETSPAQPQQPTPKPEYQPGF